ISFGSGQAQKVKNGDTINSEPPLEISDLIKKTNGILEAANGAMQNVDATTNNLKSVSSKINTGAGTLGALVNDKQVYRNVNAGAAALQEDAEALKHNFFLRGFFKKRGYEDSAELTKHQIPQLPAQPYTKKFAYDAAKV